MSRSKILTFIKTDILYLQVTVLEDAVNLYTAQQP